MLVTATALALAALGAPGCAADTDGDAEGDDVAEQEDALGASPSAAGIKAGSLEEEGVLLLVNDRATTREVLAQRARVNATASKAIAAYRTDAAGNPRWFKTLDEVDKLPSTTTLAFTRLVADARANGYVEAPGFDPPTLAKIALPPNLGRPPTSNDVTVEAGFDGKTPAEVLAIVRGRLTNTVDPSNERFVDSTITANHKAFTIAVGNFLIPSSPNGRLLASLRGLGAKKFTLLGTMSAIKPTIIETEDANGIKSYWSRGDTGQFGRIDKPSYPVIMRARLRIDGPEGQGVRVFYPAWSAKVLTGPTTVVIEGG